ncbi:TolC family protein [Helicobacter sp. MIT 05-5293]|uniref:TolC family protein n=1 Tax=Helicobacter sp. MIT 05-5293 TaxID=1548149 RepID=UPI0010FEC604|nr:TolC family protein [Helicobacter sp. MIT 05-5293]TLD80964.1 TolC family protein [Helicobacter sp. MIT 05-5293]
MKIKGFLLLLGVALNAFSAEYLEFQKAYEYVLSNNDGLKSSESATQKQEKLHQGTKLIYLPQVSLSAFYVRLQDPINLHLFSSMDNLGNLGASMPALAPLLQGLSQPITIQDQNITAGALNIVYPLFTGGKRYFANAISDLMYQDSLLALKLKKLSLFEDLSKLYYGVVLNEQILHTLQDSQEGHLTHYENAQKLQEKGQIARLEVLQAQVNYDKATINVQKANDSLVIARMALDSILNIDSKNLTEPTKLISSIKIDNEKTLKPLEYFISQTLDVYPALQIMDNKIKQSEQLTRMEFSSFLPEVALFGSYMVNDQSSILEKSIPNWFVGVGAKWSLITPTGRIQKYQASKIATLEANYATAQARKDLKTLCEKTYNEVLSYKQQYFSLDSSIELAKENLKLREKAFLQGISTSAEVSDARNMLSLALIEQQTIAYNYAISLARLMALSDNIEDFYRFFQ